MFIFEFFRGQFKKLPYPDGNFTGQTIIITGSNCGLGLEAARHFARLDAKLVILACRNASKGILAKASIEESIKRTGVVEVWPLDLGSFDSVKSFCKRAETLAQIDVLVANAGIATPKFELVEGFESTITVNVISTFLMIMLLVPKIRELKERLGTKTRVVVVTSEAHHMATFHQRSAPNIFKAFTEPNAQLQGDRYPTSKLLEILIVRELGPKLASPDTSSPAMIINAVNPGYCKSEFQRNATPLRYFFVRLGGVFVARSTEVGSRTLVAGAVGGKETHGKYMSNCVISEPADWIGKEEGQRVGRKVLEDLMEVLESIEPGIRACFQKESV